MNLLSGRLFVAAGIMLMLVGLLAFSFGAPNTTAGQETDVPVVQPDGGDSTDVGSGDVGPEYQAEPPASLPDAGTGQFDNGAGSARTMLIVLLGALGLTLAGAGAIAVRRGQ